MISSSTALFSHLATEIASVHRLWDSIRFHLGYYNMFNLIWDELNFDNFKQLSNEIRDGLSDLE